MQEEKPKELTFESAEEIYKQFLQRNKMFYTRERAVILETVMSRSDHFSVDELLFSMQKDKLRVSRATLYRSLSQLADAGILIEADFGHGHMHYEVMGGEPHEHLVCTKCSSVTEVVSPDFIKSLQDLAAQEHFQLSSHKTQVFGVCADCQKDK
jgi:Fur family ferric uptake transcriptional regulator